ncbi:MAG: ribosomal-protein-alanine N-acetyltransferase [Alphaproteobacteria bacterium]|jgi:ribosomal-protein-alanine N-acetyltransferase
MLQQHSENPFGLTYSNIFIETKNLCVRPLKRTDCAEWLRVKQNNYSYLQHREPIWDMDALTYQAFYRFLNDLLSSFSIGTYYSLGIFEKDNRTLVGGFEISNILFWPKQSASVGYWISESCAGQGYGTDVLVNMAHWALKTFNLVKIEAGTMVSNIASQRVLTKAGFSREGLSHSYGEINGNYEDHILWGITANEVNPVYLK